jgi:hypothetical protein
VQARCEHFGGLTVVPVRYDLPGELPLVMRPAETTSNEEIVRIIRRGNWGCRWAERGKGGVEPAEGEGLKDGLAEEVGLVGVIVAAERARQARERREHLGVRSLRGGDGRGRRFWKEGGGNVGEGAAAASARGWLGLYLDLRRTRRAAPGLSRTEAGTRRCRSGGVCFRCAQAWNQIEQDYIRKRCMA